MWRDVNITVHVKEEDFWSEIMGASWQVWPWWSAVEYLDGADWNIPGKVRVTGIDPDDSSVEPVTKVIGIDELFEAHAAVESDKLEDFDSASSDAIIQCAVFGEILYG